MDQYSSVDLKNKALELPIETEVCFLQVVKARPKWDRMNGTVVKDQPLEVFGRWQTEIYIPPPAVDGKVPRNEYGNVELFKPWMLPKGTIHLPIAGIYSVYGHQIEFPTH